MCSQIIRASSMCSPRKN
ncbi:hypothetical protein MTR67_022868 [Solanum verrucosum]|uniref:Uncharacterized protein n=1 Tax=Solanum verrucosum TaxID=315347 RepID=A0AAF0TY82_SOLVR|nr:hypothetical protein MTR67_022868 [Solanum verrucosum]